MSSFKEPSYNFFSFLRKQRLKVILTVLISLLILVVGAILSVWTFYQNKKTVTERVISNELPVLVDYAAVRFMENVSESIHVSKYLANSPFVKDWLRNEQPDTTQILRYLDQIGASENIVSLHVIPVENPVIISNHWPRRKLTDAADPFFKKFLNSDNFREFNIDINKYVRQKQLLFYVNNKIIGHDGSVLGLADVAMRLDKFSSVIAYDSLESIGQLYIVDRSGTIKLHNDTTRIGYSSSESNGSNIKNEPGLSKVADDILSGRVSITEFQREGKTILLMTRVLPEFDWLVVAEVPKEDFMAPYLRMLWKNLIMSILGAVLSVVLVVAITSRWVVRPLMLLKSGLINFFLFLNGDRTGYEKISEKGSREMRDMAREINREVDRIKSNLEKDQALIMEMQFLIEQVNNGVFSVRLKEHAANPRLRRLGADINHMLELLSAKVGDNLNETLKSLQQYANLNFSDASKNKNLGELGAQVHSMGTALENALHEIKSQNKELKEKRVKVDEQNKFIESRNKELSNVNAQINLINSKLETLVEEKTLNLQKAYRELDTFLYRASHDLRRPLTTLRGIVQLVEDRNTDEKVGELYELIDKVISGMDSMLKKLIAISYVSSTELTFTHLDSDSCAKLVEKVLSGFQDRLTDYGTKVTVNIEPGLGFNASEDLIESVLTNIVENTLIFSSKVEPVLVISFTGGSKDHVHLTVEDNGVGIPQNVQDRCFDMFFKGSQLSQGDGLGLYVVKKIADRLGAAIVLKSQVGKGTTIVVKFPKEHTE
ncbi:ATP-binding protein [uncultured Imperialibacter sp.]|uniref:sensor histidine kinase n=1 Tax=uncultured Imperialibacter sp. TaxID=1672639 RepID=UPI0030D6EEB6|tara:strand:+ start:3597 stop:5915 length:2319 start_codon:yes stop_codon:yes gene_type:complete